MKRVACWGMLLGTLIGNPAALAELRLNPFSADETEADVPPPLVTDPAPAKQGLPAMSVPQLSMPQMKLPELGLPTLSLPAIPTPSAGGLALPPLPKLRPQGKLLQRLDRGRQKLWDTAKAPFSGSKGNGFLPAVRPVSFQTPVLKAPELKLPKLKTTATPNGRPAADKDPQTITGWLSQPRP